MQTAALRFGWKACSWLESSWMELVWYPLERLVRASANQASVIGSRRIW